MDLQTFKLITRPKVDQVPISDRVIDAVNQKGQEQNFTLLKFKDRNGHIFYDSDWIAGVDYEETEDEEPDENDENENDANNEYEDDSEDENEINQEQIANLRRSELLEETGESNPTKVEDDADGNDVNEADNDNDVEDENETDESNDDEGDDDDDEMLNRNDCSARPFNTGVEDRPHGSHGPLHEAPMNSLAAVPTQASDSEPSEDSEQVL